MMLTCNGKKDSMVQEQGYVNPGLGTRSSIQGILLPSVKIFLLHSYMAFPPDKYGNQDALGSHICLDTAFWDAGQT